MLDKIVSFPLPITPAELENQILVVLAGDDNFAVPIAVTIASAMTHAKKEDRYLFLILSDGISDGNQEYFRQLEVKYPNMKAVVYDMLPVFSEWQHLFSVHLYWKRSTYFRLFLPELLAGYEKAIYLDGDILVRCDLAQLFQKNFPEETSCFAVEDCLGCHPLLLKRYLIRNLGLPRNHIYFNAGVLFLNIKALQKINFLEKAIQLQEELHPFYQDQDILNLLCCGHVEYLPCEWNHMLIDAEPVRNRKFEKIIKSFPVENAKILHYSGPEKPWLFPDLKYADLWWEYAAKTPFVKELEHYSFRTRTEFYKRRVDEFEKSISVKLGLSLTWIPRKILSLLLCKKF